MDKSLPVDSNVLPRMTQAYQGPTHEPASRVNVGTGQTTAGLVPEPLDESPQTSLSASHSSGLSVQDAASGTEQSAAFAALVAEGTRINSEGPRGWIDMQVALLKSYPSMSAAFQAEGPNINSLVGTNGRTALQLAAVSGNPESVAELISSGADVNGMDPQNRTPLHFTAMRGRLAMVDLLIDSKANVNAPDANGNTALHHAVAQGHLDVAKALIGAKTNIQVSNAAGMTVLDVAKLQGDQDIFDLLQAELQASVPA